MRRHFNIGGRGFSVEDINHVVFLGPVGGGPRFQAATAGPDGLPSILETAPRPATADGLPSIRETAPSTGPTAWG